MLFWEGEAERPFLRNWKERSLGFKERRGGVHTTIHFRRFPSQEAYLLFGRINRQCWTNFIMLFRFVEVVTIFKVYERSQGVVFLVKKSADV